MLLQHCSSLTSHLADTSLRFLLSGSPFAGIALRVLSAHLVALLCAISASQMAPCALLFAP
jgi:hypothetical protein